MDTYIFVATTISLIAALISIGKDVYALVMMIKEHCKNKK